MTNNSFKLFLLILISSNFISCNGKIKSKSNQFEDAPLGFGKTVTMLPQQIWTVYQDTKRNFWFGSNGEGIFQYDGHILKKFTTFDGLVHNQIRGIQEDAFGNIYIETPVGVSKYDGSVFNTLEVISPPNSKWEKDKRDLWFNCNANHLYRFDGKALHELQLPKQDLSLINKDLAGNIESLKFDPYAVFGIDRDRDGNIWIGTGSAGAFCYDGNSFLWISEQELSTLPDGRVPGVRSMIQDDEGYLWLSNFYSKYKIDGNLTNGYQKLKAVDLPADIVKNKILYFNSGLNDHKGNLWMITYNGGVWKYDGNSLTNTEIKSGVQNVLLVSIYQDKDGLMWLGTNNDGVYKQNGSVFVKFIPSK